MMRTRNAVIAALLAVLLASASLAEEPTHPVPPSPRLVGTAVLINLVYVPFRLALTAAGGVLGGLTGFLMMGNLSAAESIWNLTDGSMLVTPGMLEGTEQFHFSAYD